MFWCSIVICYLVFFSLRAHEQEPFVCTVRIKNWKYYAIITNSHVTFFWEMSSRWCIASATYTWCERRVCCAVGAAMNRYSIHYLPESWRSVSHAKTRERGEWVKWNHICGTRDIFAIFHPWVTASFRLPCCWWLLTVDGDLRDKYICANIFQFLNTLNQVKNELARQNDNRFLSHIHTALHMAQTWCTLENIYQHAP